ncbi:hypothetical protein Pen02_10770 [Plantactinospora endophytica]|uniref:Uncharacterized protein n=1 Tax=Plantactinospora endophytica TaxID=673535 RepID=A0ABQ4DUL4_9ACTN|nr:hypothetical protein Pen02_10770 [Plantactinospora endophytica]
MPRNIGRIALFHRGRVNSKLAAQTNTCLARCNLHPGMRTFRKSNSRVRPAAAPTRRLALTALRAVTFTPRMEALSVANHHLIRLLSFRAGTESFRPAAPACPQADLASTPRHARQVEER